MYCKNYLQDFNLTTILFTNVSTRWQQWKLRTVTKQSIREPRPTTHDFSMLFDTAGKLNLPPSLLRVGSIYMWIASLTTLSN